jgi:hypothetical protein
MIIAPAQTIPLLKEIRRTPPRQDRPPAAR